jgi:Flp pilus assembly pilin Flp
MNKFKNLAQRLWVDESAQGATEYIFLLVIIVALAVAFKGPLLAAVNTKMQSVSSSITGFGSDGGN